MFTPFLMLVVLLLLATTSISLVFIWWLLTPFRRGITKLLPVFGASAADRIVALGLTTLFCDFAINSLFRVPLSFVCDIISVAARAFTETINSIDFRQAELDTDVWRQIANAAQRELSTVAYEMARLLSNLSHSLPISDILLALCVWCLIGQGLSNAGIGFSPIKRVGSWVSTWSNRTVTIVAFSTLFIAGSYMCVAAIVAIPWLADYGEADYAEQSILRSRLDQIMGEESKFRESFPENYLSKEDPAAVLREVHVDSGSDAGAEASDASGSRGKTLGLTPARSEELKAVLKSFNEAQEKAETQWKVLRSQAEQQRRRLYSRCLDAFNTNTEGQMTPRERNAYAYELARWFAGRIDMIDQMMMFAKDEADRTYQRWIDWAQEAHFDLRGEYPIRRPEDFHSSRSISEVLQGYSTRDEDTPPFPKSDLDLGPFGFFAGWLVKTRSTPLALITGMIGFGIIGAGASTFVRQSASNSGAIPLGIDIIGVVVRGLSAAVVVFLAVEGGLAVFATGKNEPNAYVLFFTCLVGAVFSERVWLWAGVRLKEVLEGGGKDQTRIEGEATAQTEGEGRQGDENDTQ